jgi:hypothetical protein
MDDQPTEPTPPPPAPEPAVGDGSPLLPPPPPLLPPPPPPPQHWVQPPSPTVGWAPPGDAGQPTIDIGSIIGRSFDTFGREWSLFLALAAPAALGSMLQAILAPATMTATAPETASLEDLWPIFGAVLLSALLGLVSTVLITVATDGLWQGRPTGLGASLAGGLAALPRYAGVVVLLGLAIFGLVVVAVVVTAAAAAILGPAAAAILALGLLLLVPVGIWIGARLTLLAPVIVLERNGVVGSITRAWRLSQGRVVMLFVLSIAIGLCAALPLWGGSLVSAFVTDPLVAGLALAIATLVYQPLPVIAMTLAWGDRIGGRHADSAVMARGRGRTTAIALVLGIGLVLFVIGLGLAARYATSVPAFP